MSWARRTVEEIPNAPAAAFLTALTAHHQESGDHTPRVARVAVMIGREMNLTPGQLLTLHYGSLLHDLGKIGVSETILNKPGKLTPDEWDKQRLHPQFGAEMAREFFSEGVLRVIAEHHEKWDGSGYPLNLRGEKIALEARICAVADTFDVITHSRPYQAQRTYTEAHAELKRCSGTQFDPQVIAAFCRLEKSNI